MPAQHIGWTISVRTCRWQQHSLKFAVSSFFHRHTLRVSTRSVLRIDRGRLAFDEAGQLRPHFPPQLVCFSPTVRRLREAAVPILSGSRLCTSARFPFLLQPAAFASLTLTDFRFANTDVGSPYPAIIGRLPPHQF